MNLDALKKVPWWGWVIAAAAAGGLVWFVLRSQRQGGQAGSAGSQAGAGLPSQIDPLTGVPYSVEGATNQSGTPFYYLYPNGQPPAPAPAPSPSLTPTSDPPGAAPPGYIWQWAINKQQWVLSPTAPPPPPISGGGPAGIIPPVTARPVPPPPFPGGQRPPPPLPLTPASGSSQAFWPYHDRRLIA